MFLKNIKNITSFLVKPHPRKEANYQKIFEYPTDQPPPSKASFFIVIRSLKLSPQGFEMHWPDKSKLKLNSKEIFYNFQKSKTDKPKADRPIFFGFLKSYSLKDYLPYNTSILSVEQMFQKQNKLEVSIPHLSGSSDKSSHVISVDLIEVKDNVDKIISDIEAVSSIRFKEAQQRNSIISKETVSLIDVCTGTERIKFPARGLNCLHLGVFDLKVFLSIGFKTRLFICPLCGKNSCLVYIDSKIKEMIEAIEADELLIDSEYNLYKEESEGSVDLNSIFVDGDMTESSFEEVISLEESKESKRRENFVKLSEEDLNCFDQMNFNFPSDISEVNLSEIINLNSNSYIKYLSEIH